MDDCISRKAAIDCLNNVSFDCSMDQEVVEEELLKLPSVKPEQWWIPVTEESVIRAGYEGREVRFRIRGRLFAIRELAQ